MWDTVLFMRVHRERLGRKLVESVERAPNYYRDPLDSEIGGLGFKWIKFFLRAGADPNSTFEDEDGKTALMWAVEKGFPDPTEQTDIMEALVNAGADVNLRDANGHTALWYAQDYETRFPEVIAKRRRYGVDPASWLRYRGGVL